MSDHQLRRRVQSGFLEQTGPHSFRLPGAATGPAADLRALVLDIGEPCWVSGPTAAALHGFDGFVMRRPLHVTVLRDRNVRRIGAIVHTTAHLPAIDRESRDGLPVTSPTRTIIDLARTEPPARLSAAVDSALRDGLTSEDLLHRRIAALRAEGPLRSADAARRARRTRDHPRRPQLAEREFLRLVALGGNRPGFRDGSQPRCCRWQRATPTPPDDCRFPARRRWSNCSATSFQQIDAADSPDARRLKPASSPRSSRSSSTYEQVEIPPEAVGRPHDGAPRSA